MSSTVKAGETGAGGGKEGDLGFASKERVLVWAKSVEAVLGLVFGRLKLFSWEGFFGEVVPKKNTTITPRMQRVVKVKVAHFIGTGVPIYR
jgi:hypothetical protein